MKRGILGVLCFVGSLGLAESLEWGPSQWNLSASNHTLFTSTKSLENEDTSPQLLRSQTQVGAESGAFNLGLAFSNRFAVAKQDGSDVPLFLEKKFATFESSQWKLTLGDSHQELGRGVALSLFRDDTFGIDYTVEGASVKYAPEEWEIKSFGGRVRALKVPVALIPFQSPLLDREIWLGSVSVKYKNPALQVGAHYLMTLNRPLATSTFDKRWHTAGLTFQADGLAPGWDAYAESNLMVNEPMSVAYSRLPNGVGTYASLVYSPLPWKLKVELKDYRNYGYDFRRPPSLEEDIVTSLNFSNVTAARFWLERRMGVYNSIRASLLVGDDRTVRARVNHAVASAKLKLGEVGVEARSGYRWLPGQSDLLHGDVKLKIPTFQGQYLEVGYRKLHAFNGLNFLPTLDDRNFFDVSYTFSARWSLNLGAEYVPSNPAEVGQGFFNAGTLVKFDSFTSRAFVGSTSGGPQCSGGICRLVPAYSGMMLEGTYAF